MLVLKFGGTSVATSQNIRLTEKIVRTRLRKDRNVVVVCSALGGVTNDLLRVGEIARKKDNRYQDLMLEIKARHQQVAIELLQGVYIETYIQKLNERFNKLSELLNGIFLLREISPRTKDYLSSFGEINSTFLIHSFYQQEGLKNRFLDTRQVIITDTNHTQAKYIRERTFDNLHDYYYPDAGVVLATGFISSSEQGWTTTLGRGGSDLTASIIGAALDADYVEIWTDVNGVLSSNPKMVTDTQTIDRLTYIEAMEMSHFGAKVIYAPTLRPLLDEKIPLYIKNTFNPEHPGTLISQERSPDTQPVKGVSTINDISLITLSGTGLIGIPGTAARLFNALAHQKINIILITQGSSEHSICFGIIPEEANLALDAINEEFKVELAAKDIDPPKLDEQLSVLALVGENMKFKHGVAGKIFNTLGDHHINVMAIAQGSSELNISVVIKKEDAQPALNVIHKTFFAIKSKIIHLYIVGVGLVGKTFLDQIKLQRAELLKLNDIDLRVVGISNSTKMIFDKNGIELDTWARELKASYQQSNLVDFINKAQVFDLPNSVLVDITSSTDVSNLYDKAILAGLSVATPNKIAFSQSKSDYTKLLDHARHKNQFVVYETTVGAGLPIINTISGLQKSGDRIRRVQGILSGSLSYIFSELAAGKSFSQAVIAAKELGFTEPDPRTDISGLDFKRKLAILSNLSGFSHTIKDIKMEAILDPVIMEGLSVEAFMRVLPDSDALFAAKIKSAGEKRLRLIGDLDKDNASIKMVTVGPEHPFYYLSGSDNIVAIQTDRYKDNPLIIRGPGAGAHVTAGGLMADIISSFN